MHIINSYSLAGAEKLVYDIVERMEKTRFKVFICSIGSKNDLIEKRLRVNLHSQGVTTLTVNKVPNKQRVQCILKLVNLIRQNNIDIIHTHCSSPDFYGRIAAFISRVPQVYSTIHSTVGYSSGIEKILSSITSKYVAISRQVEDYALNDIGISKNKLKVIYNGVDTSFRVGNVRKETKLKELGLSGDRTIITAVGRITEAKGYFYLIQAAKTIVSKFPKVHFLIVGDKESEHELVNDLKKLVIKNNLEKNITFTGVRQDVPEILAITDIFVSSSVWEGLALVSLEAMAAGLPVVATDVGSIREVVNDKINGLIIPPRDIEGLCKSIEFMLKHPDQAWWMGKCGKEVVEANFSIDNTVYGYESLYHLME